MERDKTMTQTIHRAAHTKSGIWEVSKRIRNSKGLFIVTSISNVRHFTDGLSFGAPINDGWEYDAVIRRATPEEDAASKIAQRRYELEKELRTLQGGADDYRDEDKRAARRAEITAELKTLS
jgi:hypothetical protein